MNGKEIARLGEPSFEARAGDTACVLDFIRLKNFVPCFKMHNNYNHKSSNKQREDFYVLKITKSQKNTSRQIFARSHWHPNVSSVF